MSRQDTILMYAELGVLKVCIAPSEPFYTIPMVVANKRGESMAFGNDALEKDDSWELTWVQLSGSKRKKSEALFKFVLQQPEVRARGKGKSFLVAVQFILGPRLNQSYDRLKYCSPKSYFPSLFSKRYEASEDRLSVMGWNTSRYSLNISGDFTCIRRSETIYAEVFDAGYIEVGFDTIVNLFIKLLCEKGYDFTATQDRIFCQQLVIDYCFVALDFEKELERIENLDGPLHEIKLEDGTVLELGKECIIAPEVLFDPGLVGMDEGSIMSLFHQEKFLTSPFPPPVMLTGGCAAQMDGLGARIQCELEAMNDGLTDNPIQVIRTNIREGAKRFVDLLEGGSIAF